MKKLLPIALAAAVLGLAGIASAQETAPKKSKKAAAPASATAPKSVMHVVTVSWKAGTTPEQIQAALD
ncbi:MAG: hypothetical protein ACKOTF_06755, partial [Opitutaceae bacterium]